MSKHLRSIALLVVAIVVVLVASTFTPTLTSASAQVAPSGSVARMWHGCVPAAKSEEYMTYLNEAGLKKIRAIEGNLGLQMFRAQKRISQSFMSFPTGNPTVRFGRLLGITSKKPVFYRETMNT